MNDFLERIKLMGEDAFTYGNNPHERLWELTIYVCKYSFRKYGSLESFSIEEFDFEKMKEAFFEGYKTREGEICKQG